MSAEPGFVVRLTPSEMGLILGLAIMARKWKRGPVRVLLERLEAKIAAAILDPAAEIKVTGAPEPLRINIEAAAADD